MHNRPSHGVSFAELMDQARRGCNEAAEQLTRRYGAHVLRTVRRSLGREIRRQFDSQDFVQLVWASFFASLTQRQPVQHPDQLTAMLTAMARFKVIDEMRRRLGTQKYAVQREQPWQQQGSAAIEPMSREASPSEVAMARERWRRMLQSLSDRDRQIICQRVAGRSRRSIARRLGLHEKTVQRVLERLSETQHDGDRIDL